MKTLRFRLDVVLSSDGRVLGADLRVRDMATKVNTVLGGFSGEPRTDGIAWASLTAEGLDGQLLNIKLAVEREQKEQKARSIRENGQQTIPK